LGLAGTLARRASWEPRPHGGSTTPQSYTMPDDHNIHDDHWL
jgi:hypothetical protein